MFRLSLCLLSLLSSVPVLASDLTDILKMRESTFEDRAAVAKTLSEMGKDKPLTTQDAIAEVCYEIDMCASATPQDELDKACAGRVGSEFFHGDICYFKNFREQHTCNDQSDKFTAQAINKMLRIFSGYEGAYRVYTFDKNLAYFASLYNLDVSELEADPKKGLEFLENNPEAKIRLEALMSDSAALGQYTMDCYQRMNQMLYANDNSKLVRYFNLYKSVINSLEAFPQHKGMVNRGVNFPEAVLKEHHKVGNVVCYNGFTSTAVHDEKTDRGDKPSNYFLEEKCVQRLYIKYEDNGAKPGRLIDGASIAKGEREVLFEPGACFRIDAVSPRTDNSGLEDTQVCNQGQRYNFEMTLMPSGS